MGNGKAAVAFVAVLLASFVVMNVLPANDLPQACVQEAALALVALAGAGFAVPGAFKRCASNVQQRNIVRFAMVALLLTGLVGGAITLATWGFVGVDALGSTAFASSSSSGVIARNLAMLLGICILTGVYEESFLRVLGIEAFERAFERGEDSSTAPSSGGSAANRNSDGRTADLNDSRSGEVYSAATKRAILVSTLLFALLHVGAPDVTAGQQVLVQSALKFAQALLFGTIMGVLYAQTRRLWPCALLHAGFDAFYLAPHVLLTGALPTTYASGTPGDTVLLTVTVILLAAVLVVMVKRQQEIECQ